MPPALSIVVATYRREQVLCDMLRALLDEADDAEIIVVDQTPVHEPATEAYLAAVAGRVRRLRLDTPNLPRARNAGWRAAAGDIVMFLDDDVRPHPGLVAHHRDAYADPAVGGVAGRVLTARFPLPEAPNPKSRLPGVGWLFFNFAQTEACDVETARGCHMSFRRRVLEEVGGFDERIAPSPSSREETELCFRLRRRGYRLRFEPRAVVEHLVHPEGGERGAERDLGLIAQHHVNNFYFFWKAVPRRHRPLTFLVLLIQEFRRRQAGVPPRGWRGHLRVAALLGRGLAPGGRRAREASAARLPP